jgi:hypothetical protein
VISNPAKVTFTKGPDRGFLAIITKIAQI